MGVSEAQAQALGGVKAELFRLTLHGDMAAEGLQALHDSQPEIHELTLRSPARHDFHKYFPDVPSLQCLTLRDFVNLTGKSLPRSQT